MGSICTDLALYGSKNERVRNDAVFLPISQVCDGTVSLWKSKSNGSVSAPGPSQSDYFTGRTRLEQLNMNKIDTFISPSSN